MGGGSSKSSSSQDITTITETTTSTSMGDVGLTGAQAVDMAAVLESGAVQRAQINADFLAPVVQATGNAWNQLVGGAGQLVQTSAKVAENTIDVLPIITKDVVSASEGRFPTTDYLMLGALLIGGFFLIKTVI